MTPEQRAAVVAERKARGFPCHTPPHFDEGVNTYMLTAACFEHQRILSTDSRLNEFSEALVCGVEADIKGKLYAWVILRNHYHLLAELDLAIFRQWVGRLHNGKSTQWNREDGTPGRKVWYRFSDRRIRNYRHLYASLNYIHFNPVKHKYVYNAGDWPWSSIHEYLERLDVTSLRSGGVNIPSRTTGEDGMNSLVVLVVRPLGRK